MVAENPSPPSPQPSVRREEMAGLLKCAAAATTGGGLPALLEVEVIRQQLPRFDIQCVLGHGGMGVVYRGWCADLECEVAVKVLAPDTSRLDLENQVARFEQEARVLEAMEHPNIVRILETGRMEEGHLFFAMELVEGSDLAKRLKDNAKLPVAEALRIVKAVAEALQHAHSRGIIHRDIKPGNILLGGDGKVKVVDFGLAKLLDDPGQISITGLAVGTPAYMAPEALEGGKRVDARADIFALGVMLYQMLTGMVPKGDVKRPGISRRLDKVVMKAMAHDPEARYPSAEAFLQALAEAPTPGTWRARRCEALDTLWAGRAWLLAALLALGVAAWAVTSLVTDLMPQELPVLGRDTQTVLSNFVDLVPLENLPLGVAGAEMAQAFTTGPDSQTVAGVSLVPGKGSAGGAVDIALHEDDASRQAPGALVRRLRDGPQAAGEQAAYYQETGGDLVLEPKTKYWLVVTNRAQEAGLSLAGTRKNRLLYGLMMGWSMEPGSLKREAGGQWAAQEAQVVCSVLRVGCVIHAPGWRSGDSGVQGPLRGWEWTDNDRWAVGLQDTWRGKKAGFYVQNKQGLFFDIWKGVPNIGCMASTPLLQPDGERIYQLVWCSTDDPVKLHRVLMDNPDSRKELPVKQPAGLREVRAMTGMRDFPNVGSDFPSMGFERGDVLIATGTQPGQLWRWRPDATSRAEPWLEGDAPPLLDVTVSRAGIWVLGEPEPGKIQLYRVVKKRLVEELVRPPLAAACGISTDNDGGLYVLEGGRQQRFIHLTRADVQQPFTARVIASGFRKLSACGVDSSRDGRSILITDQGAGTVFTFKRE